MKGNVWLLLLLQLVLILCNAVFACAEIAVISFNDNRLEKMAEEGDKRAKRLAKLTEQPSRFLSTIQVAITLAGFLGSAFAADNFAGGIVDLLLKLGVPMSAAALNTIAVVVITLILSYITLVFGELVPKRLAMKNAEEVALALSGLLSFFALIFRPLVGLLTISTNGVLRLLGIDPDAEDEHVSEEEIRMMVDVGSEKGVIDDVEKMMIQNVFEFDDLTAGEFCTHRTELTILWDEEDVDTWHKTICEVRHAMYPICGESADDIIGVLNSKEYFRLADKSRENIMKEAVRPARFVPETIKADVLFKEMKKSRDHFAVVLDEYGGVQGIVTMNDLLELLVGDLEDDAEAPVEKAEIEKIDENTFRIMGTAPLEDVEEALGLDLPTEDCDTFGGLVFAEYGSVPEDGTTFELTTNGMEIKVTCIDDHRIEEALVTVLPPENEEDGDEE